MITINTLLENFLLPKRYNISKLISSTNSSNIYTGYDKNEKKVIIKEFFYERGAKYFKIDANSLEKLNHKVNIDKIRHKKRIINTRITASMLEDELKNLGYSREEIGIIKKICRCNESEKLLKKFIEEIEFFKSINHKNLASIYDYFSVNDKNLKKIYIVMDYITGKTLRELQEENKGYLSQEKVIPLMLQICNGLDCLSEKNVFFYYLSPDHIIVTDTEEVKLINFGFGRFFRKDFSSNPNMGIAGYSAPEQYGTGEINSRADIFGLGAIMYYMLTGEEPGHNSGINVKNKNPSVSEGLNRIINKCLQEKTIIRFDCIKSLEEKLRIIMETHEQNEFATKMLEKEDSFPTKLLENEKIEKKILKNNIRISEIKRKNIQKLRNHFLTAITLISVILISILLMKYLSLSTYAFTLEEGENKLKIFDLKKRMLYKSLIINGITGKLYLSDPENLYICSNLNKIYIFNPKKMKVKKEINLSFTPSFIRATSNKKCLYVADKKNNKIIKMEEDKISPIIVENKPVDMALSADEKYLYVLSNTSDNISVINTLQARTVEKIKNTGTNPDFMITAGAKLYIFSRENIAVIDTVQNKIRKNIKFRGGILDGIFSRKSRKIYCIKKDPERNISAIDTDKDILNTIMPLDMEPTSICCTGDNKLYISLLDSLDNSKILLINTAGKNDMKDIGPKNVSISNMVVFSDR